MDTSFDIGILGADAAATALAARLDREAARPVSVAVIAAAEVVDVADVSGRFGVALRGGDLVRCETVVIAAPLPVPPSRPGCPPEALASRLLARGLVCLDAPGRAYRTGPAGEAVGAEGLAGRLFLLRPDDAAAVAAAVLTRHGGTGPLPANVLPFVPRRRAGVNATAKGWTRFDRGRNRAV